MSVSFLQELDAGADTAINTTTRTKAFTSNISAGSVLLACFSVKDGAPYLVTVSDNKSNTWISIGSNFDSSGRGVAAYYAIANAGSIGTMPIVSFTKSSNLGIAASILELAGVTTPFLDVTPVVTSAVGSGPAQATLGITTYTNDAIIAVLGMEQAAYSVATPLSGYTDSVSNTNSSVSIQHKVQKRLTTATAAYTPGWTISAPSNWNVVAFALRGSTTSPTITSSGSATPANGSALTVTGVNLGATTGTVSLGGIAQTVTAWSDTSITFTVARGTNKYGAAVSLIATTSASVVSNTFTGISLLPQTGWSYINLTTPNATAANRITAVADLVSGDQLAYDTISGGVIVSPDATFSVGGGVASFSVEAWRTPDGWGSAATQTITASSISIAAAWTEANDALAIVASVGSPASGVIAWTEANDLAAISASLGVIASAAWTEASDTSAIAASVGNPASGVIVWTEANDTAGMLATVQVNAAIGWAEASDAFGFSASVLASAGLSWTEANDVAAIVASVSAALSASISWTESNDTLAIVVTVSSATEFTRAPSGYGYTRQSVAGQTTSSRLITAPDALAVTLADAKANLRIDGTDLDAAITMWIDGITAHAEHITGRAIISQAWRVTIDEFPAAIVLPNSPLASVTGIKFIDADGVLRTLHPDDYTVDLVSEPGHIVPAYDKSWPDTYTQINAVTVDYVCGYGPDATTTPKTIRLYILAKLMEQFDPAVRLEKDTVQASFIDAILDREKVYA